ncbi:MAG: hypothetical protein NVS3B10_02750 [Polyangiales bacterium]
MRAQDTAELSEDSPRSGVAPPRPDAPGVPFPPLAEDAYDAELAALAGRRGAAGHAVATLARVVAIVAAAALVFALRYDLRFAAASRSPVDLPGSPTEAQLDGAAHRVVSLPGVPGGVGAVDYQRPLGRAMFRLAPLVDRPDVYVELRLPEGIDPVRYIPPTSLRGRLVPIDEGGARFASARALIAEATGRPAPARAWILEQGAEPSWSSPGAVVGVLAGVLVLVQSLMLGRASVRAR